MIDLKELTLDFTKQIINLNAAKEKMFMASEEVIKAELTLADLEAELTAAGIEGKNAEERKANLIHATSPARGRVEITKEKERIARFNLEAAQIQLDGLRYRLRIAELMSKQDAE